MYMIDLPLDTAALSRFAWRQGHASRQAKGDEDFGYAAHAWLAAALGEQAPRPFRLLESRAGLRLLGYSLADAPSLAEHASAFALPDAQAVCRWQDASGKEMPLHWASGRRLGFEVRACPVSRGERERDIYLVEVDQAETDKRDARSRAAVYSDWLVSQLARDGAAALTPEAIALAGFRRVKSLRQSRSGQGARHRLVERPDALFTGELTVTDPAAFATLLARGVGRHRAFGFGMLLLRPPQTGIG